jgi:alpha-L-fucosidase
MHRLKIPISAYEMIAKEFNPVKFDAMQWVKLAKDSGMKYLVITAKHHDGFAMYASKYDDYNIINRTPFGRDPMKELSEACHAYGIKFCFYYSLGRDWHHPHVPTESNGWRSNTWDFPDEKNKDVSIYFNSKVKQQITELLTNYGPIGLLWFDTHELITKEQSRELVELVRSLQPECIINGRVGNDEGDYLELPDNQIPKAIIKEDWETPVTLNESWGYSRDDHNWKSSDTLLKQLAEIVSKGGNYLLNVGPTAKGVIPQPSVERLKKIGEWLKLNGESIYSTSPFLKDQMETPWGYITSRDNKLYLLISDWSAEIVLKGVKGMVKRAYFLDNGNEIEVKTNQRCNCGSDTVYVLLPQKASDEIITVAVLEF